MKLSHCTSSHKASTSTFIISTFLKGLSDLCQNRTSANIHLLIYIWTTPHPPTAIAIIATIGHPYVPHSVLHYWTIALMNRFYNYPRNRKITDQMKGMELGPIFHIQGIGTRKSATG
jgi:hypothetical protein